MRQNLLEVRYRLTLLISIACGPLFGQGMYMPHMLFRGPNDCHREVYVIPKITSIDSQTDFLEIEFVLFGIENDAMKPFSITGMSAWKGFNRKDIYTGDSLVLRVRSDRPFDSIVFPSKPEGFKEIIQKRDRPQAMFIDKNSDYTIYFNTPESCYEGEWQYDSRYGHKDYRWLFDSHGVYTAPVNARYENWSKKDYIAVYLKERKFIHSESFKVIDSEGNEVGYDLIVKRDTTRTIALALHRDLKAHDNFTLLISDSIIKDAQTHQRFFKYPMNVGGKGTVGLAGKYSFLEE